MKRWIILLTTVVLILVLAGCAASDAGNQAATQAGQTTQTSASTNDTEASKADDTTAENNINNSSKTLVVYFSATGNTKGVAEQIASVTGADSFEILAAQPYTEDDLNWNDQNSRSTKEQNDKTIRPEIGSEKINLDGYDMIFIGFPIWWGEEPRIMDTFVESYDFSGKTLIPFCTSSSSPINNAAENLKINTGGGDWKDGRRFSAEASRAEIEEWIKTF